MQHIIGSVNDIVWGAPALILILGVGLYLSLRLRFVQITLFPEALKRFLRQFLPQRGNDRNSSFQALCTKTKDCPKKQAILAFPNPFGGEAVQNDQETAQQTQVGLNTVKRCMGQKGNDRGNLQQNLEEEYNANVDNDNFIDNGVLFISCKQGCNALREIQTALAFFLIHTLYPFLH